MSIACVCAPFARAQDLPVITYTTADGLPNDLITRTVQDASGFLWVGTTSALARFDGETFKLVGQPEGLDVGTGINDLRFDSRGFLWISTNGAGLLRLDLTTADAAARLKKFSVGSGRSANRVNSLALTADGTLWAGTDAGLFRGRHDSGQFARLELPIGTQSQDSLQVIAVVPHASDVWLATTAGVYRCRLAADGECASVSRIAANAILFDGEERLWVGTRNGLSVWTLKDGAPFGAPQPIGDWNVLRLARTSDGGVLVGTEDGRAVLAQNGRAEVIFETATSPIYDLTEDAAQNIWVATKRGLLAIRRQGVRLFTFRHGLQQPYVGGLFRDAHSRVYALTDGYWLHRLDGDRLIAVRLMLPPGVSRSSFFGASICVDAEGDVWLGTAHGLVRYSGVIFSLDRRREFHPSRVYTTADGLAGDHVAALFEDSDGDLWISNIPTGPNTLTVWRRRTGRFERVDASRGMPPFNQPLHFVEPSPGVLWAALREGGVLRIRDGKAAVFGVSQGLPPIVFGIAADQSGRVLLAGLKEIVRVSHPSADVIEGTPLRSSLPSRPLAIDVAATGEIFIGTQHGLYAIDEGSGAGRPLSSLEGLPAGGIEVLLGAPDGTLLVTAGPNLARVDPSTKFRAPRQIRCVIGGISLGSRALFLPEAGVERYEGIDVLPSRNEIAIDFLAVSPYLGEALSYEHRLTEISDEWGRSAGRQITYVGLGAGRYTFEVRARGVDGSVSAPATMRFRVLPPWYRRWWFLASCGCLITLVAYAGHRTRLAQAIYAEQLRSRIATDLHDDLGASLSQIAVFSEVLRKRRNDLSSNDADGILEKIGTTSRELVSSMSDIVWAVNPRYDSLIDLAARMRRFAEDTFAQGDTAFEFSAPAADHLHIGPAAKREILLILKEGVTNIVKHARARRASASLATRGRQLTLRVWDDGQGFDPDASHAGNGIRNLRRRVAALGGTLTIVSAIGQGTEIVLHIDTR
jgi:ligand-binding sensor domain-containing protein/two-component sensor histidine kinase